MSYRIRLLDSAVKSLKKMDRGIARRITDRLQWLGEHYEELDPQSLRGELTGLYKLRVGDHRAIYQPLHDEQTLIVHMVGHRREIYRSR